MAYKYYKDKNGKEERIHVKAFDFDIRSVKENFRYNIDCFCRYPGTYTMMLDWILGILKIPLEEMGLFFIFLDDYADMCYEAGELKKYELKDGTNLLTLTFE